MGFKRDPFVSEYGANGSRHEGIDLRTVDSFNSEQVIRPISVGHIDSYSVGRVKPAAAYATSVLNYGSA